MNVVEKKERAKESNRGQFVALSLVEASVAGPGSAPLAWSLCSAASRLVSFLPRSRCGSAACSGTAPRVTAMMGPRRSPSAWTGALPPSVGYVLPLRSSDLRFSFSIMLRRCEFLGFSSELFVRLGENSRRRRPGFFFFLGLFVVFSNL